MNTQNQQSNPVTLSEDALQFSFRDIEVAILNLVKARIPDLVKQVIDAIQRSSVSDLTNSLAKHEGGWVFKAGVEESAIRQRGRELTSDHCETTIREIVNSLRQIKWLHKPAVEIHFQRTLRVPEDDVENSLPAGLGKFPLCSVDDFPDTIGADALLKGGVVMPMYQSESLWISFRGGFPAAVMIGCGKINALTGQGWSGTLDDDPQNYLILPDQPWLDGFAVAPGVVRQFVATPLGGGATAEEQITGQAQVGGMQIQVIPMRAEIYFEEEIEPELDRCLLGAFVRLLDGLVERKVWLRPASGDPIAAEFCLMERPSDIGSEMGLGLGLGGKIQQQIYSDATGIHAWDVNCSARCFVHIVNSMRWRKITGENPPQPPITQAEYKRYGIPWFDHYRDDLEPLAGSKVLNDLQTVGKFHPSDPAEDATITPKLIIQSGNTRRPTPIRDFTDD